MKRPDRASDMPTSFIWDATDDELAATFPTLAAFLMDLKWDDGKSRKPGTVMLINDRGRPKAWVHDVDGRRAAFVSGESLWCVLRAVNEGLALDDLDWRADRK